MSKKIIMLLDNPFISDSRVEKEISSLVSAGFKIDLICEEHNGIPKIEKRGDLTIYRKLNPLFKKPLRKNYTQYIKKIAKDVLSHEGVAIHCHDYHMLQIGCQAKLLNSSIKLVYDTHEYLKGWPFYKESPSIFNRYKGYLVWKKMIRNEAQAIKNVDFIFTVSQGVSEQLNTDHNLEVLPSIIQNYPIKTNYNFSKKNYFRDEYNLSDETHIIVHSGNIYMPHKTISGLIKFISSQKNLVLIFMGNRPKFFELKKRYKNSTNIYFHEYFDQKKNIELMSSANIGLCFVNLEYKSHYLTSVNRYMEYNYAGLAVFSSDQKEISLTSKEVKNTCFFENNTESIINCIETNLNNIKLFQANARENSVNYNWENEGEKLINYYSNI